MITSFVEITGRDPIVARDGRPFGIGQGNRMRSLSWPLPSVVAGSMRTALGNAAGREFSTGNVRDLLVNTEIAGFFPVSDTSTGRELYLPAPQDCFISEGGSPLRAAPVAFDGGANWPTDGLHPVAVSTAEDSKPGKMPAWWPLASYANWMALESILVDDNFLLAPEPELRTHVSIDPLTGAAKENQLFTSAALPLTHLRRNTERAEKVEIRISVRMQASGWPADAAEKVNVLHPLGGERRLLHSKAAGANSRHWECPLSVREALAGGSKQVRMVLATPAIFRHGWKPGWLGDALTGTPPGTDLRLKLAGLTIQRWRPVSGWSLAEIPELNLKRGPKPIRRMVPAGGVYFFEVVDGNASQLADRWLEPVSDDGQDRRDGFGLAAWGIWQET